MFGKRQAASLLAEFLGTSVLTLVILSVQRSQLPFIYFVSIGAGLALAALTFLFGNNSGAHFNPAITIGLWTARKISTLRAIPYVVVQMLGGFATLGLFTYYTNTHLSSVGGHFSGRILAAEAIGSAFFAMGYAATVYKTLSHNVRSAFVGISYTLGILAASSAALGLLNPAVALGIKAWVWGTYVLGPILGAVIGINLYGLLFAEPEVAVAGSVVVPAPTAKKIVTSKTIVKKTTTKRKAKK
jgi:glycerol uptake facilitator-like aquaporin